MKRFENQLIVITGGSGMIGSSVIRYLNDNNNDNIVVVDDLKSSGKWKNLVGKRYFDFVCKQDLFEWLNGKESEIDAIIHLGAESDTLNRDGSYFIENNYHFSQKLVEFALKHDHRFIYASSFQTYGRGEEGFVDDEVNLEKLKPLNIYAYSKHMFDLWLKRERMIDQVAVLKFFNIFGPNEGYKRQKASMIRQAFDKLQSGEKVELFKSNDKDVKDGEQQRDLIYSKDVATIVSSFLNNDLMGIYNVGSGIERSFNTQVAAVGKALGMDAKIDFIDLPVELEEQYQMFTKADVTKLKEANLLQLTDFDAAVEDYVQNHLLKNLTW